MNWYVIATPACSGCLETVQAMQQPLELLYVENDELGRCATDATRQKLAERVLEESGQRAASQVAPGEGRAGSLERMGLRAFSAGRSRLSRYGVAMAITAAALLACARLLPLFGRTPPGLVLLTLAIAAAAWWGGLGPGLIATGISTLMAWWALVLTTWHIFLLHFLSSSRTIVSRDGRLPASD